MVDMNEVTSSLITIPQFCERHSWPPHGGLRWLIFNAKDNGFAKCVVRVGRRVLIDEREFEKWLDAHRQVSVSR